MAAYTRLLVREERAAKNRFPRSNIYLQI